MEEICERFVRNYKHGLLTCSMGEGTDVGLSVFFQQAAGTELGLQCLPWGPLDKPLTKFKIAYWLPVFFQEATGKAPSTQC